MRGSFIHVVTVVVTMLLITSCSTNPQPTAEINPKFETTSPIVKFSETPEARGTTSVAQGKDTPEPYVFQQKDIYDIGDLIKFGDDILLVAGWYVIPDDANFPAGKTYYGVDLILVNQSSKAKRYSPEQAILLDGNNSEYKNFRHYNLSPVSLNSNIKNAPGERIRGTIVFQLPQDAVPSELVWRYGLAEVKISLGKQPVVKSIPDRIPGEITQTYNYKGDVVEVDKTTVSLKEIIIDYDGDSYYKPEMGYKFVFLALSIANSSSKTELGGFRPFLKDQTGQVFGGINRTVSAPKKIDCDGESGSGCTYVAFEIPIDMTEFSLILDSSSALNDHLRFMASPGEYLGEKTAVILNFHGHVSLESEHGYLQLREAIDINDPFVPKAIAKTSIQQPKIDIRPMGSKFDPALVVLVNMGTDENIVIEKNFEKNVHVFKPSNGLSNGLYCLRYNDSTTGHPPAWCFMITD